MALAPSPIICYYLYTPRFYPPGIFFHIYLILRLRTIFSFLGLSSPILALYCLWHGMTKSPVFRIVSATPRRRIVIAQLRTGDYWTKIQGESVTIGTVGLLQPEPAN